MPASTCWQCFDAVRAPRPASAFAMAAEPGDSSSQAAASIASAVSIADQRLGQPVADRLEAADRLAELHAVERVLAGQREHPPRRADELVAERELAERDRAAPRGHR